jgi:Pyrimidine operon attenuation protein/uracil phosphoribosyltransferase
MNRLESVDALLEDMASQLKTTLDDRGIREPLMVGIHTGGVWVAQRLHAMLGLREPLGMLDIAFYRDDFSRIGVQPVVRPSTLPFQIDDRHVVLVDDVLYTGRTIRAALNELFDYGRPASVLLAVLIDRGQRELPIAADVCGARVALASGEQIKLQGPDPLKLVIRKTA